jgi:uncharacterized membrane protein
VGGAVFIIPMSDKTHKIILSALIGCYIFYFSLVGALKFYSYSFHDFDLAVHAQSAWCILHGSIYNSILGIPFLGNHLNLILFLIAPLYFVFQSPFTLLFIQTLLLGLGALPVYLLARRILDSGWALVIAATYLLYPPLAYTNLFEFHPPALAVFFILFTIYYYYSGNFLRFMVFAFLSMFCQENIPLAVFMLGFLSIITRKSMKWVIVPVLTGGIFFLIALFVMNTFNKDTVQFASLYRWIGDSPQAIALNIFSHPLEVARVFLRRECLIYIWQMFLPVVFIPVFSPVFLLPALPFFAQHMLSSRATELSIQYHYAAEITPFIFLALIYGIKFIMQHKLVSGSRGFKIIFLCAVFLVNLSFGPHFDAFRRPLEKYKTDHLRLYKNFLVSNIPRGAGVVATFEFLPHLTERKQLYSFHHIYMGFHTLSDKPYLLPDGAQYALLDFNDPLTFRGFYSAGGYKNIRSFIAQGNWQIKEYLEDIVLLEKGAVADFDIFRKVDKPLKPSHILDRKLSFGILLSGYDAASAKSQDILELTLYWQCVKPTDKAIGLVVELPAADGKILGHRIHAIGYRVFPTNSWAKGDAYIEKIRIKLAAANLTNKKNIKFYFFDSLTGELLGI